MNHYEALKTEYPHLISWTRYMDPKNYEVIDFEKFIQLFFSIDKQLISEGIISEIRNILISTYGNDQDCIVEKGILSEIEIESVTFYQKQIGIMGPKNTDINEPVKLVRYGNLNILYNGYHRFLYKVLSGENIYAYVLEI